MSIISKKTWDKFTQEEKDKVIKDYNNSAVAVRVRLEAYFGKENLQPAPLSYKDVVRELFEDGFYYYDYIYDRIEENSSIPTMPMACTSRKQTEKLLAINKLLNVAKFLNGDWKPDWNYIQDKWYLAVEKGKVKVDYHDDGHNSHIIYFRTKELAKQAIQILGEDTVRLTLTTEY